MTVTAARQKNLRVDDAITASQRQRITQYLESWRNRTLEGVGIPGDAEPSRICSTASPRRDSHRAWKRMRKHCS